MGRLVVNNAMSVNGAWPAGPRIFDGAGPVPLELIGSTTFASGVLRLAYRPAPERRDGSAG